MWSITRGSTAVGGVQTRQYSSMPESFSKKPGPTTNYLSGLCGTRNFNIVPDKQFTNPNFVNKQNPNVHRYPCNVAERCKTFLANNPNCIASTNLVNKDAVEEIASEMKENTKRRKRHATKKSTKGKTKNSFNAKYETVDEIGLDPLSDSYESSSSSPCCFEFLAKNANDICISSAAAVVISINAAAAAPQCRSRIPSDCGSEDSFVVFQCSPGDDFDLSETGDETDTESEEYDDDDSDDSSCSESNFIFKTDDVVAAARKKVRFADDLCEVHPMVCWSYAYQAARKGPWEEYARDRGRFKDRIQSLADVLGTVLQPRHRRKVFDERFAATTTNR